MSTLRKVQNTQRKSWYYKNNIRSNLNITVFLEIDCIKLSNLSEQIDILNEYALAVKIWQIRFRGKCTLLKTGFSVIFEKYCIFLKVFVFKIVYRGDMTTMDSYRCYNKQRCGYVIVSEF